MLPRTFALMPVRRAALLLTLPLLLTACLPPEQEATSAPTEVTESLSAEPEAGTQAHSTEGHDMTGHDMGGMEQGQSVGKSTGTLPLEVVGEATVTAVPASLSDTTAYVTLRNTGDTDIVLIAASSPASSHAMLMNTVESESGGATMSGMVEAQSLTVPAGGELVMASAGDHVMLMGLIEPLQEGAAVPITLQADDGRTLEVSAVVRKP